MRNTKQWLAIFFVAVMVFTLAGCAPGPTPGPTPTPTPTPTPGGMEKDFTLPTVDGESFTLGDHLGRPIVVSFFTTTCPACSRQIAPLNAIHSKYSETRNLLVLGVGAGTMQRIASYVEQNGIHYPAVVDEDRNVTRDYGVRAIPHTFFINRQGRIVDDHLGWLSEGALESYLARIW